MGGGLWGTLEGAISIASNSCSRSRTDWQRILVFSRPGAFSSKAPCSFSVSGTRLTLTELMGYRPWVRKEEQKSIKDSSLQDPLSLLLCK